MAIFDIHGYASISTGKAAAHSGVVVCRGGTAPEARLCDAPRPEKQERADMVTVYVERGATFSELKRLTREGRTTLIHFPYDEGDRSFFYGRWNKYLYRARSSLVTCDTTQLTFDEDILISDMEGSSLYRKIQKIVGRESEHDVRHLDAAYKSKADAFLTQDKRDIVRNRAELEQLIGLRIFHSDDDRVEFLEFVERHVVGERSLSEGQSMVSLGRADELHPEG